MLFKTYVEAMENFHDLGLGNEFTRAVTCIQVDLKVVISIHMVHS